MKKGYQARPSSARCKVHAENLLGRRKMIRLTSFDDHESPALSSVHFGASMPVIIEDDHCSMKSVTSSRQTIDVGLHIAFQPASGVKTKYLILVAIFMTLKISVRQVQSSTCATGSPSR